MTQGSQRGIFGEPGQYIHRHEGVASEVRIPWQQLLRLAACNLVLYATISAVILIIVPAGTEFPRWLVKAWWVGGLLTVAGVPAALGAYRYAAEVADPGGPTPPRVAVERHKPIWPWTQEPYFEEDEEEAPPPNTVREYRPVPVRSAGTMVGGNGGGPVVTAPSGRPVRWADLVKFIRHAPLSGTASNIWKNRGWKLERWQDVIDLLHLYGVVSERRPRTKIQLQYGRDEWDRALQRVADAL